MLTRQVQAALRDAIEKPSKEPVHPQQKCHNQGYKQATCDTCDSNSAQTSRGHQTIWDIPKHNGAQTHHTSHRKDTGSMQQARQHVNVFTIGRCQISHVSTSRLQHEIPSFQAGPWLLCGQRLDTPRCPSCHHVALLQKPMQPIASHPAIHACTKCQDHSTKAEDICQ